MSRNVRQPHTLEPSIEAIPLRAESLSFSYGSRQVLVDASIEIRRGEFVALTGGNGAGKSTLVKVMLGLLKPSGGTAELFGSKASELREQWSVGYVPQRAQFEAHLPATVEELVATGRLARGPWWRRRGPSDRAAIDHALGVVDLTSLRRSSIHELSGGQQQRAFIARALAAEPVLLVLDEPIAGVDSAAQTRFREALVHHVRVHDGAVLLVSHDLGAVADSLTRVVALNDGRCTVL